MDKVAFDKYMREASTRPFKWGVNDCFLFAAGAVAAGTGKDHMADLRGYGDETTAAILLQERFGTLSLAVAFREVARRAGAVKINPEDAKTGDVALVSWPRGFQRPTAIDQSAGLGVFHRTRAFVLSPSGLVAVPLGHRVIELWRF